MRILWFTWKDGTNPRAGGAEVVSEELALRLTRDGHQVTFVTAGYEGAPPVERRQGFRIIRVGNRWTVYWKAWQLYRRELKGRFDMVIDEVNTMPFFSSRYAQEPALVFIHQLARKVWFYEMAFPFSLVGYLLEPLYLKRLRRLPVVTVSPSSKADLVRYGFRPDNISIISEGTRMPPVGSLSPDKPSWPVTWLALGSIRDMKRTDQVVQAFELACEDNPEIRLVVAGRPQGRFGQKVRDMIALSRFAGRITLETEVTEARKQQLLTEADLLVCASAKEGWGLVVTEANRRGTPAVAYRVDGLKDSIRHGETGLLVAPGHIHGLAQAAVELTNDPDEYERYRRAAWEWGKTIEFDLAARQLTSILDRIVNQDAV